VENIKKRLTGIFPRLQKKEKASIKRKLEGFQERKMNFQNIWLKGNINKK
jgi:hypothetical protein